MQTLESFAMRQTYTGIRHGEIVELGTSRKGNRKVEVSFSWNEGDYDSGYTYYQMYSVVVNVEGLVLHSEELFYEEVAY